jgi:hypothetical protein
MTRSFAKQACEAGRPTKSPSSKPSRQSGRPSPHRASLQDGVADQVPIEQLGRAKVPIQCFWPTSATTRRVITDSRSDIRAAYRRSAWGHHQHDCTPPRKVSVLSPLPCRVSQSQSWEDLNVGVSTVTHIPGKIGRYAISGVCLSTQAGDAEHMTTCKAVHTRPHHETDPQDPPHTTTKTSTMDSQGGMPCRILLRSTLQTTSGIPRQPSTTNLCLSLFLSLIENKSPL